MTDSDTTEKRERHIQWERRFQSVMVTMATAGMIWVVQTLVSVDKAVAIAVEKQGQLEISVAGMYSSDAAKRDVIELNDRIRSVADIAARQGTALYDVQGRVRVIEDRLHIRRAREAAAAAAPHEDDRP